MAQNAVTNGPTKASILTAFNATVLGAKTSYAVEMLSYGPDFTDPTRVEIVIQGLQVEDGGLERFNYSGFSPTLQKTIEGYYDTCKRTGTLKF